MADVTVRPPTPGDEVDWRRLWACFQAHFGGTVPDDVTRRTWSKLLAADEAIYALVATSRGKVCGIVHYSLTPFAWTASPVCFLQDLYVDPEARGSGAGRALVEGVYAAAELSGAANVFWLAALDDEPLMTFYRRIAVETPFVRFMQKPWQW